MKKVNSEEIDVEQLMELPKSDLIKLDKESIGKLQRKIKMIIEKIESKFNELEELMYDDDSCDWKIVYDDEKEKVKKITRLLLDIEFMIKNARRIIKR